MKKILILFLFCCVGLIAQESKIIGNVTLKSGAVLRNVQIVRWEKDLVILKHAGGIDPVRFENMSPEMREIFERFRSRGVAGEALKGRIKQAIQDHSLIVGMTPEDAIASWGKPNKINATGGEGGSFDQWIYFSKTGSESRTYVYFRQGLLTSWSD